MVNASPMEFLAMKRIEKAKELLRDTDLRVTDIAYHCGFQSSQYFSTVFRRYTSRTPAEFRADVTSSRMTAA